MFSYIGSVEEDTIRSKPMRIFNEFFARPRPDETIRYRTALRTLESMTRSDLADINIKPADFPRIAREMAQRAR
jgi:uncharacterized protein YjiS (DUF1127 family)